MENERKRDSISYEDFTEQHKKRKSIKNMSEIISYLNLHNLYFKEDHSEGIPRITMVFKNCDRCPDYITEGCIWFYENSMEVRVYYSKLGAEICQKSKYLPELYKCQIVGKRFRWSGRCIISVSIFNIAKILCYRR